MTINVDDLKAQLVTAEAEFEQTKAHLYRLDGIVQLLKKLIATESDPPAKPKKG